MRGTNQSSESTKGWVAAVTPTHKLILSDEDDAWLLNLERDPDELVNFADDPEHSESLKFLAARLQSYGEKCGEKKLSDPHTEKNLRGLL